MRNKVTGKYEVRRYYSQTGQEIVGIGDTAEQAKEDFKAKLRAYREKPVEHTGEYLNSPGYTTVKYKNGKMRYEFREDRKAQVYARVDLARKLREENRAADQQAETTAEVESGEDPAPTL